MVIQGAAATAAVDVSTPVIDASTCTAATTCLHGTHGRASDAEGARPGARRALFLRLRRRRGG